MISHEQMIAFHADSHDLIRPTEMLSPNDYVLHRMHTFAYTFAATLAARRTVLDVGCNTGYGSRILAQGAAGVVGVDVSPKAIAFAREEPGVPGLRFQVIGMGALPFGDATFDVITCFQVLEHVVDYAAFLTDLRRVLKPGGVLLLTTPNAAMRLYPGMKPWNEFHVREFTGDELRVLLNPFFPQVSLWGLYAREPYYTIEAGRLAEARDQAATHAGRSIPGKRSFRNYLRSLLSPQLLTAIRRTRGVLLAGSSRRMMDTLMRTQTERDFFYRNTDLDGGLDLLAICSDDEHAIEAASFEEQPGDIGKRGEAVCK